MPEKRNSVFAAQQWRCRSHCQQFVRCAAVALPKSLSTVCSLRNSGAAEVTVNSVFAAQQWRCRSHCQRYETRLGLRIKCPIFLSEFCIFLTVHLRKILVSDQLDAQFLLYYVCFNHLRVSSIYAHPQEDNCINP